MKSLVGEFVYNQTFILYLFVYPQVFSLISIDFIAKMRSTVGNQVIVSIKWPKNNTRRSNLKAGQACQGHARQFVCQPNLTTHIYLCSIIANSYRFRCRHLTNSSSYDLHGHDGYWGSWSTWKSCPVGTAICGIQTQYEGENVFKDTTGINDAKFFCCKLPDPCIIYQVIC